MLEDRALRKTYGDIVAVDDVWLRAEAGETIGLLGPNGAGKTTTVSIIAGLVRPDAGEVLIHGRPLGGDTDPLKLTLGLVPQDLALYDELPALQNLMLFAALYNLSGAEARKAIGEAMDLLVADQDGSAVSQEIIASLAKRKTLDVKPADAATACDQVRRGKATVAVIIPKDFGQNSGQAFFGNPNSDKPEVGLLYDPSRSAEPAMIEGVLTGEIMQAVSKEMFGGATGRNMVNEALGQIQNGTGIPTQNKKALEELLRSVQQLNSSQSGGDRAAGGLRIPFTTHDEAVTSGQNVEHNGYAHAFAGMTVQFVLLRQSTSASVCCFNASGDCGNDSARRRSPEASYWAAVP
jgi:ABC-type Fe3+/spermidine/putrescine transport system ATPase subunit